MCDNALWDILLGHLPPMALQWQPTALASVAHRTDLVHIPTRILCAEKAFDPKLECNLRGSRYPVMSQKALNYIAVLHITGHTLDTNE